MIVRDRTPITKKEPAQPGDLQDGVLYVPLTFIRMIGGGGMGEVWEAASDDLPGHRFAVKVIASEHVRNQDVIARFFGEARAASAIDDPNIVMIHGTGRTADGRPALVMPYIEGRSLADLCEERGPLPLDAVAKILLQLASALRAAHGNQIVHRDIKLQNVMITNRWGREWFVILVDFGIAKFHDAALAREIHTNTKQYIGTPGYSAPEQILGKRVDEKADVYSLGVLAYRMLCGRAPYVAENNMQVMHQQLDGAPFDEPKKLRSDMPPVWNEVIRECMLLDPRLRPTPSMFAKRIAAGARNGSSLLQSLAPRIAAETRSKANEITLSSDVPTALSQLDAQTRHRRGQFPAVAALAAGLCVGVVSTAIAMTIARPRRDAVERGDASAVAARDGSPAVETDQLRRPPETSPGTSPAVSAGAPGRTTASTTPPDPAVPSPQLRTGGEAPAATPEPAPSTSGSRAAATSHPPQNVPPASPSVADTVAAAAPPRSGGSASTPPREAVTKPPKDADSRAAVHQKPSGDLVISVEPFAAVTLDGRHVGWTPFRTKVPVGEHTVFLENKDLKISKSISVTVSTDKPARIEETW